MSSFIFRSNKKSDTNNWVKVNAAGSVRGTPADSWRAYLTANSGTGQTLHDLESSFLKAAGAVGGTLQDKWADYLGRIIGQSGGKGKEKARNRYK